MGIWKCIYFKKRNIKRDLQKVKSGASALESEVITLEMAACSSGQLRRLLTKQNTNCSSCCQVLLILLRVVKSIYTLELFLKSNYFILDYF